MTQSLHGIESPFEPRRFTWRQPWNGTGNSQKRTNVCVGDSLTPSVTSGHLNAQALVGSSDFPSSVTALPM